MKKNDDPHPYSGEGEKIPDTKMGRFLYWMKNKYWYYYRFHTVGIIAAILLTVILIKSYNSAYTPDFTYILASEERVEDGLLLGLSSKFSGMQSMPDMEPLFVNGVALYVGGENEMINAQRFSIYFVDEQVSFFIIDSGLEEYWGKSEFYIDLTGFGIETVADRPWLADVTEAMKGLGIGGDGRKYYAAIQALGGNQEEGALEESIRVNRELGINFIWMLLENTVK